MERETIYKLSIILLLFYLLCSVFIIAELKDGLNQLEIDNDKLSSEIEILKNDKEDLNNEIQLMEDEVTYWGMKYDSSKIK